MAASASASWLASAAPRSHSRSMWGLGRHHPCARADRVPSASRHAVPKLRSYPKPTVVAEKLEAMVQLGMQNSRMKDFFDLHLLANGAEFAGPILVDAISATFTRRKTPLPSDDVPLALTDGFANQPEKPIQWSAFLKRNRLDAPDLASVIIMLRDFLMPPLLAAANRQAFQRHGIPRDRGHSGPETARRTIKSLILPVQPCLPSAMSGVKTPLSFERRCAIIRLS